MARKEFETLTPQMFYILLSLYQPRHGYEIMQEVATITNNEIQIGAGTLYTLLPRFEKEGYIELEDISKQKKTYVITKKWKEKLLLEKERMLQQIRLLEDVSHEI